MLSTALSSGRMLSNRLNSSLSRSVVRPSVQCIGIVGKRPSCNSSELQRQYPRQTTRGLVISREWTVHRRPLRSLDRAFVGCLGNSRKMSAGGPPRILPDPTWITDPTNTLTTVERQEMAAIIHDLFRNYGVELTVLIENTISPYIDPRDRALDAFNTWGVGSANKNNGVLIYMLLDRRRLEVVTGDGIRSVLSDSYIQHNLETRVTNEMRQRGKGAGIIETANICADALWKHARLDRNTQDWAEPSPKSAGPGSDSGKESKQNSAGGFRRPKSGSWLLPLLFLGFLYDFVFRRRRLICDNCGHFPMSRMNDSDLEKTLTNCQKVEKITHRKEFNRYACPQCNRVSPLYGENTTLLRGTERQPCSVCHCDSMVKKEERNGQEVAADALCLNCNPDLIEEFRETGFQAKNYTSDNVPIRRPRTVTIAPEVRRRDSSSSSSGGGSFGGGKSSGGGGGVSF